MIVLFKSADICFMLEKKMVLLAEKNVFFMKIVYLIQDNTFEQK